MWFSVCIRHNNGPNHGLRLRGTTLLSRRFGSSHNMGRFGLYKRISPLGDPKFSIVPVLDEWVREGNSVNKQQLRQLIKELTKYSRFGHALEKCDGSEP
ncbi:PREDICTED: pentatricopeptide repeat-containing protein At4g21705, mitochondrial-like [Tarenaya hassleriana]|uniref:pentatricopeptide repeat-containing protein At4g21705, mitochondrial-like n=1 Tax=Tarenaya hassleriana TaxID=28532 RepID=UPI0008FD2D15|nr:PREDICTED: pentatricopeptide repeat-containing protein At4g21705, mitochondrial-like [Tarenaya hassleriana]